MVRNVVMAKMIHLPLPGPIIGPTTVVIQAGAQARVMSALAELGILAEGQPGDLAAQPPSN